MIPLYRGELHKVSGVPRQWTVPKSQIPLSVFKIALKKRSAALSRLLQTPTYQNTDARGTTFSNGSAEASDPALENGSEEDQERVGPESDDDEDMAENGHTMADRNVSERNGQSDSGMEDSERRQERKRRRDDDFRVESGQDDAGNESPRKSLEVDIIDQRIALDVKAAEGIDTRNNEAIAELATVGVSELGTSSAPESKFGNELGFRGTADAEPKDLKNLARFVQEVNLEGNHGAFSNVEQTPSSQIVTSIPEETAMNSTGAGVSEMQVTHDIVKKRQELEAKLEKLRAERHRFVLRLKQVLIEEESKKRGSVASGSPASVQIATGSPCDAIVTSTSGEKHGIGESITSADLEDGELDYARTPSPPSRLNPSFRSHGSQNSAPVIPAVGRQTSLSQHLSQNTSGRGGYFVPGLCIPPSSALPGMPGGAQSPGTGFMGNLPSPLGSHKYSHNLALQHVAASHAQKVTGVTHGHGQFSSIPPNGGPVGVVQGVTNGPPGFSGYAVSSLVHSHHSHLSQSASSSLPHISVQQGVSSSSLLTSPRGPPGYHDVRFGK